MPHDYVATKRQQKSWHLWEFQNQNVERKTLSSPLPKFSTFAMTPREFAKNKNEDRIEDKIEGLELKGRLRDSQIWVSWRKR